MAFSKGNPPSTHNESHGKDFTTTGKAILFSYNLAFNLKGCLAMHYTHPPTHSNVWAFFVHINKDLNHSSSVSLLTEIWSCVFVGHLALLSMYGIPNVGMVTSGSQYRSKEK